VRTIETKHPKGDRVFSVEHGACIILTAVDGIVKSLPPGGVKVINGFV
jgi:hypothetical protein